MLGETFALSGDLNQALAHYQTGAKLAMNDNERADSYERLASAYQALAQYDQAIEYQLKAVVMQKMAGDLDQYANASLVLGKIYITAKDYVGAERTLNKLLQFCKDNGGAYYEAKTDIYLAQSKAGSGNIEAARMHLSDASTIAKNIHANDLIAEIDSTSSKLSP
jgi:tetratricopeptide (TPR) repeat protein